MKDRRTLRILAFLVGALLFGAAVWFVLHDPALRSALRAVNPLALLLLTGAAGAAITANGYYHRTALARLGARLAPAEWIGLAALATLANYVAFGRGGIAVRALWCRTRHGVTLTETASVYLVNQAISFVAAGALGLLLVLLAPSGALPRARLAAIFALVVAVGVTGAATLVLLGRRARKTPRGWFAGLAGSWDKVTARPHHLVHDALLLTGVVALFVSQLIIAHRALGLAASPWAVGAAGLLAVAALVVSIVPANLGIQELLVGLGAHLSGVGLAHGITAALVVRVAGLGAALALSPVGLVASRAPVTRALAPTEGERTDAGSDNGC